MTAVGPYFGDDLPLSGFGTDMGSVAAGLAGEGCIEVRESSVCAGCSPMVVEPIATWRDIQVGSQHSEHSEAGRGPCDLLSQLCAERAGVQEY